jgi:hypothetical protein
MTVCTGMKGSVFPTLATALSVAFTAFAQSSRPPIPVTSDNFVRAESDLYFGNMVKEGGFGKFAHHREPMAIDNQIVIRSNRDTLYSLAVFDLDAGPVTITLPDVGGRFMSMVATDEDQYQFATIYKPGEHNFTKEQAGTRYMGVGLRTLVNPDDPEDVKKVHALQDAVKVEQPGGPGKFEVPNWDPVSQNKVRDSLLVLYNVLPDQNRMFGTKTEVDPVRHLIGAAGGWGGNPEKEAIYLNVTPKLNDGKTVHRLTVKEVPVDGFWSISIYDAKGYYEKNPYNAYSLNNLTTKKNADGSSTVQFGGCDGKILNCLPIMNGWNYMVRLYRPRPEILSGTWKFPEAQPMN